MFLRRWPIVCVALAVGSIVGIGADRRPLGPAAGTSLHGSAATPAPRGTFRIGTFNIHGGRDAAGRFDLDRTASCLHGLHVVGLNEVYGRFPWQAADQAELLGRKTGLAWLFAPNTSRWYRDDFGNGLLSSLPVRSWRREPLHCTQGKGFRNLIVAELEHEGATIHLIVTHLDRVRDRKAQLEVVIQKFLALPPPAILMGDLNTTADDPQLARLLATPGVVDCVADGLAGKAPKRIDWIIARGLRAVSAGIEDEGASDHPLVWAEVEVD
jgi:endonuclease/exonuclease/phosphatase family metal-dependent hydrolase